MCEILLNLIFLLTYWLCNLVASKGEVLFGECYVFV